MSKANIVLYILALISVVFICVLAAAGVVNAANGDIISSAICFVIAIFMAVNTRWMILSGKEL